MRIIETKVYTYEELSNESKAKARDWYRRASDSDTFWSEHPLEEAVEQGELMGIEFKKVQSISGDIKDGDACIFFSGFSSQGDGACFEGTWHASEVQADKVAEGWGEELKRIASEFSRMAELFPNSWFTVTHRGLYCHENCTEFDLNSGYGYGDPSMLERFRTDPEETEDELAEKMDIEFFAGSDRKLKENAKDFMRLIYRSLNEAYDYAMLDEVVEEEILLNNYEFTEDGNHV